MQEYNSQKIEPKWQKHWKKEKIFEAKDFSKSPKFYILDMFPYPSGAGLHVGHPRGYIGTDVIAHYMRMRGYNVLHPMGWDAFGLPAENYAIKTGIHPSITTKENIKRFKKQMKAIGLSYDWSREINTTDPNYYKWTQWIFLKLFKKGLAYRANLPINWCPSCKTGLANEEVVSGRCERCGEQVFKKNIEQWVLKITAYAERLLKDLKELDWPEQIKEMQKNWIGKSEGAEIKFQIENSDLEITVFTTRPDTILGATFLVLAPEHNLIDKITTLQHQGEVKKYQQQSQKKLEFERQMVDREKTGVFVGSYAINPANAKRIPIYIADYVLPHYARGAIMGVPAYDERDLAFAKKYNIPIENIKLDKTPEQAIRWLEKIGCAKPAVTYKLRDWIFSRQRYWGEPIPLVFCQHCAKKIQNAAHNDNSKIKTEFNAGELLNPGWIALSEKDLPLKLPKIKKYQPTGTGESPLSSVKDWIDTKCPKCGGKAVRETNTMPQWAGSCWYFLAYAVKGSSKFEIRNSKLFDYWLPVDFYVGGAEHAVLHLLYARFWTKVLYDEKVINFKEPFLKLRTIGLILAPDGQKMSKSKGNVINPDEIIKKYGADTFRVYEMFMGPFDQAISWDPKGILGAQRFLQKVWRLFEKFKIQKSKSKSQNSKIKKLIHKTIKKVTEDIEQQKFNTAIASMMALVNEMEKEKELPVDSYQLLIKLLAPFAPHIAEELWRKMGNKTSILCSKWPKYNLKSIEKDKIILVVQINGRTRDQIEALPGISERKAEEIALRSSKVQKWIEGKEIKKIIFIKDKLINFVV